MGENVRCMHTYRTFDIREKVTPTDTDTTSMSSEPPAKRMRENQRVEMAFLGPRGTYGEQVRSAATSRARVKGL